MLYKNKLLIKSAFFVFLTLVIMNSIKLSSVVLQIGSIGKLAFCIGFIGFYFLLIKKPQYKIILLNKYYFISAAFLLISFSLIYNFRNANTNNLLINLAFPLYFIFYLLIVHLLTRANHKRFGSLTLEATKDDILRVFRLTLFIHLIFWFAIAIGTGANMFEVDGNFGGFFQDEIQIGLYSATGFLISFYLRFKNFRRDNSTSNLLLMFMYVIILLFSSRNSLLIVLMAIVYFFGISKIQSYFYKVLVYSMLIIFNLAGIFLNIISTSTINEFTSGRWTIWTLATNRIFNNGLIFGQGLSNFNDNVLRHSKSVGSYYLNNLNSLSIHCSYIELLGAGGLVTLILFFVIQKKTWARIQKIDKTIMIAILSGAIFESILVMPFMIVSILFYILLFCNNTAIKIRVIGENSILKFENEDSIKLKA